MKSQNETKGSITIAIVALFIIYTVWIFGYNIDSNNDATFLYNRCYQMFGCLRHGFWPFIYYNDLDGIGYGTPIFYGQLTLLPFGLLLFDKLVFVRVYVLCALLLNFFGFRFLAKRFTSYSTLSACIYILSVPYLYIFGRTGLHAGVLGLAFSWYFFAFCVDYFRDGRHLHLFILTYFLTWQSNFNSVLLATIGCFALFCYYFDIKKWRSYIKLFLCVLCVVLFNIVSIIIHLDALRHLNVSTLFDQSGALCSSWLPFGGFLFRGLLGYQELGYSVGTIFSIVLYSVLSYQCFQYSTGRLRVILVVLLFILVVGYVVGLAYVWPLLYSQVQFVVQFPIRYFVLLFGGFLIFVSEHIKPDWKLYVILLISVFDIFISSPFSWEESIGNVRLYDLMVNAEFASDDFVFDKYVYETYGFNIVSISGSTYAYENLYNGLSVDCSSNVGSDILTLPKLYYKGYHAYAEDGGHFAVTSGYSNYCEVDIGSYTGLLTLRYEVPPVVLFLFWIQVFCVSRLLYLVVKSIKWNKFLHRKQKVSEAVSG